MARRRANQNPSNYTVGYIRRSTDRQEQSIPDQKKAIETYAAEKGLKLVKFYVDDAISCRRHAVFGWSGIYLA